MNYGLGNFVWYHNARPDTGVLKVRIRNGSVVSDQWDPAVIQANGRPVPMAGARSAAAVSDWRQLRGCTDLAERAPEGVANAAPATPDPAAEPPSYVATVQTIDKSLRERMRFSHRARCPLAWTDLRYLRMSYVGFDDRVHLGEMVVHKDYADGVTQVFERLYDAKWPIRQMRLVDDYRGDDNRSMAANNTSAYNCRRVAATGDWSNHAFGAAIDINPIQNPYIDGEMLVPPAGRRFADIDRSAAEKVPPERSSRATWWSTPSPISAGSGVVTG